MKNRIVGEACIFLIALVLISSVVTAVTVDKENSKGDSLEIFSPNHNGIYIADIPDAIIWDNGMWYYTLFAAQLDDITPYDGYPADDFQFEIDSRVSDVHWIGGYWGSNYQSAKFNWNIMFYKDRGDGNAPGTLIAGPFNYTQDECNPILVDDTGNSIYYKFSADLPDVLKFNASEKYWISIIAVGQIFPQSGIGIHKNPTQLHQAVFKSQYFGFPDWNDTKNVLGYESDICFQLTVIMDKNNPEIEITKPVKGIYLGDNKILPRFIGLPIILGDLTIEVNAEDMESGIEKVEFYGGIYGDVLLGTDTQAPYNFSWKRDRIRFIHLNMLRVVAYDKIGNTACDSILVKKIL